MMSGRNDVDLATLSYFAVDDDHNTRRILEILLGQVIGSPQVLIFENSQDFPKKIKMLPFVPSLSILDIAVEPYNGYQMLQLMRQMPIFDKTKIIAVTARVMSNEIDNMKTAGFDGMISKPIIRQVFPKLLQRIMAGESIWYLA